MAWPYRDLQQCRTKCDVHIFKPEFQVKEAMPLGHRLKERVFADPILLPKPKHLRTSQVIKAVLKDVGLKQKFFADCQSRLSGPVFDRPGDRGGAGRRGPEAEDLCGPGGSKIIFSNPIPDPIGNRGRAGGRGPEAEDLCGLGGRVPP